MTRAVALVSFLIGIAILVVPVARLGFLIVSSNPENDPHGYGLVFSLMLFLPLASLLGTGLLGLPCGGSAVRPRSCSHTAASVILLTFAAVWFDPFGLARAFLAAELVFVIATAYGLLIVGIETREGG